MSILKKLLLISMVSVSIAGCGKYGPPLPPEAYAPQAPQEIVVTGADQGVTISWVAPSSDARGKELTEINHYLLLRRENEPDKAKGKANESQQAEEPLAGYTELAKIEDTHILKRDEMRARLRAEKKPARRADVSDELKKFSYVDTDVKKGQRYLYRVVPINQGSVEGIPSRTIAVNFNGAETKFKILSPDEDESFAPESEAVFAESSE